MYCTTFANLPISGSVFGQYDYTSVWMIGESGFDSRWMHIFLLAAESRLALGPTHWGSETFSGGVKFLGHEAHPTLSSADIENRLVLN
jgi:hypothetical protein